MSANNTAPLTGEEELAHFRAIPWCAKHLTAPNLTILPAFSNLCHKADEKEDALMSKTLHTPDTIPAFVLFWPRPEDENDRIPEVKALFTVGEGIGGYPGISHGGIAATLLDEVLSFIAPQPRLRILRQGNQAVVTAYLNTRFLRPLVVPATYLATARLVKAEGKKTYMEGWIETETGQKVAEADALFVEIRAQL